MHLAKVWGSGSARPGSAALAPAAAVEQGCQQDGSGGGADRDAGLRAGAEAAGVGMGSARRGRAGGSGCAIQGGGIAAKAEVAMGRRLWWSHSPRVLRFTGDYGCLTSTAAGRQFARATHSPQTAKNPNSFHTHPGTGTGTGADTGAGGRGEGGGEGEGRGGGGGGGGLGAASTHTASPGWRPVQLVVGFIAMKASSSMPGGQSRVGTAGLLKQGSSLPAKNVVSDAISMPGGSCTANLRLQPCNCRHCIQAEACLIHAPHPHPHPNPPQPYSPMLDAMKKQKSPGRTMYCCEHPGSVELVMVALVIAAGPGRTISGPLRV